MAHSQTVAVRMLCIGLLLAPFLLTTSVTSAATTSDSSPSTDPLPATADGNEDNLIDGTLPVGREGEEGEGEGSPLREEMSRLRSELLHSLRRMKDEFNTKYHSHGDSTSKASPSTYPQAPYYGPYPPQQQQPFFYWPRRPISNFPPNPFLPSSYSSSLPSSSSHSSLPSSLSASEEMSALRNLLLASEERQRATDLALQQTQSKVEVLEDLLRRDLTDRVQATDSRSRTCEEKLRIAEERLESAENKLNLLDRASAHPRALRLESAASSPGSLRASLFTDDSPSPSASSSPNGQGSTFVRWGRTQCPENTQLIYAGAVGGSHYDHTGAAANHLCLTLKPEFLDNHTLPETHTILQGAEYEHVEGHHNHDVPCAVCRAPQPSTIMIPGALSCPPGEPEWRRQYAGFLVTGHHSHKAASEFLCMDLDPESRPGGHEDKNGALFYHVTPSCGSLPCPPYTSGKAVTCAVCSM